MVAVAWDCVCGLRYQLASGWCTPIQLKKLICYPKVVFKNQKDGEFSPSFAIAASLDCGGGGVGGSSLGSCLWTKISTDPWMLQINLINKIMY